MYYFALSLIFIFFSLSFSPSSSLPRVNTNQLSLCSILCPPFSLCFIFYPLLLLIVYFSSALSREFLSRYHSFVLFRYFMSDFWITARRPTTREATSVLAQFQESNKCIYLYTLNSARVVVCLNSRFRKGEEGCWLGRSGRKELREEFPDMPAGQLGKHIYIST
jgi:hypothetical protein